MVTLRPEQFAIFQKAAIKSFEERMLTHLLQFFPDPCAAMEETKLRENIRYGIQQSAQRGIVTECDVCIYIEHMTVFGQDFDHDPRYPWAGQTLADERMGSPSVRLSRLSALALETLRTAEAVGSGKRGLATALDNASQTARGAFSGSPVGSATATVTRAPQANPGPEGSGAQGKSD